MSRRYDLVVVGGGTAGLVASTLAAGLGARVVLIERERTGGDCLWTGCVPSKSLIASARLVHAMRHAADLGLSPVEPEVDYARVMDRVHAAIATLEPHDAPARLRAAGVEVLGGSGRFVDGATVEVDGHRLDFAAALVATGAAPVVPSLAGLDAPDVLTSETLWGERELPARLAVLGGGPIGCELAQAFARLGSAVVLVEAEDRLLPAEEPAASALVARALGADGVDVRLGATALHARRDGAARTLALEDASDGAAVPFDRLLVAVGRRPRTAGLGLEEAGVTVDARGAVVVDERLRTAAPRIYAAGDVTARLPFTHVAAHHARVAAVNALLGTRRRVDDVLPWVTFTHPEVARVGLTEAQARARWGARATVAQSDYATLDRAGTEADTRGFALLVGDPRGRLVGATVAAPAGGEAIAELTARVKAGDKLDALSTTVHAYPTFAEGPSRAADEYLRRRYGRPAYRRLVRPLLWARRTLKPR